MSREIPTSLSLTLLLLMQKQGRSQKEIASALGVSRSAVSSWVTTGRGLDRARLEQIVVDVLKLEVREIDQTLRFLDGDEPAEVAPELEGLTSEERGIVEEAVAELLGGTSPMLDSWLLQEAESGRARRAEAEADACWKRYQEMSTEKRALLIEGVRAYQTPAFCARICAESKKVASRSASRALALAKLALNVAERVPGPVSLRCQGYAWAFIANASQAGGKLPEAEAAFARARELWDAGTVGDPSLPEWRFHSLFSEEKRPEPRPGQEDMEQG
jgi:transcriptional regulator with XRE-family HTH domain